jgi:hypothetical protein
MAIMLAMLMIDVWRLLLSKPDAFSGKHLPSAVSNQLMPENNPRK